MDARSRLAHLLELANSGPTLRGALALELEALLADWPAGSPLELRVSCEALLIQMRAGDASREALGRTLVEMARSHMDIRPRLAQALQLPATRIDALLGAPKGLAAIAKALSLPRAAFSSLALLLDRKSELDLYETVTEREIASITHGAQDFAA